MQRQQQLSSCPLTYPTLGRCPAIWQVWMSDAREVFQCCIWVFQIHGWGNQSLLCWEDEGLHSKHFGDGIVAWVNLASPLFCCLSIFTTKTTSFTSYVCNCNKCQNLSAETSVKHTIHIDCFRNSAVASYFGNLQELTLLQILFDELVLSSHFSLDSKMWRTFIPLQLSPSFRA